LEFRNVVCRRRKTEKKPLSKGYWSSWNAYKRMLVRVKRLQRILVRVRLSTVQGPLRSFVYMLNASMICVYLLQNMNSSKSFWINDWTVSWSALKIYIIKYCIIYSYRTTCTAIKTDWTWNIFVNGFLNQVNTSPSQHNSMYVAKGLTSLI
jgi:hypothetical protein